MSTPIDPPQSRRAARQAEVTAQDAHPEVAAPPLTRRARGGAPANVAPSAPGDVEYRTQIRPRVPHYDAPPVDHPVVGLDGGPIAGGGSGTASAGSAGMPPYVAPPLVEPLIVPPAAAPPVAPPAGGSGTQVRRRDFRPPAEQPAVATTPESAWGGAADAPLDYHTQLASHVRPPDVTAPPLATPPAQATGSIPNESTLSRRELRELRDRSLAQPDSSGVVAGVDARPGGPRLGDDAQAPAAFTSAQFAQPGVLQPTYTQPAPAEPAAAEPAPAQPAFAPSAYSPGAFDEPRFAPQPIAQPIAEPLVGSPINSSSAQQPVSLTTPDGHGVTAIPTAAPESLSGSVAPADGATSTATGSHWSVGIHDDEDPFVNTFSREVGSAVSLSNTNALVLPEMPTGGISGPVAGTGEIIITGMIDVPRVVSSTGAVPAVHETAEIDDFFDPGDLTTAPPDAAPVSALKAVSSHTSSHSVIATNRRPASNTITTVLVASTVVMAVVAIGLFVIAAANGLF